MSKKLLRGMLIFWTLFIGLGAVGGGLAMLIDPMGTQTGLGGLLPGLRKLPFADVLFQNLIFSGIALLIVNGFTQLFSFALLARRHTRSAACSAVSGIVLMLWICIQFFIFEFNVLSTAYFIFGLVETATAIVLLRKETLA